MFSVILYFFCCCFEWEFFREEVKSYFFIESFDVFFVTEVLYLKIEYSFVGNMLIFFGECISVNINNRKCWVLSFVIGNCLL